MVYALDNARKGGIVLAKLNTVGDRRPAEIGKAGKRGHLDPPGTALHHLS